MGVTGQAHKRMSGPRSTVNLIDRVLDFSQQHSVLKQGADL
jgi:hypothetical protein